MCPGSDVTGARGGRAALRRPRLGHGAGAGARARVLPATRCRWTTGSGTSRNSRPPVAWRGAPACASTASCAWTWRASAARRSPMPASPCPRRPLPAFPVTYVPARNTMMLALALGWAEVLGARDIFLGVNVLDSSGYPDCRPEFIAAFEALAARGDQGRGRGRAGAGAYAAHRVDQGADHHRRARASELTTRRPCPATRPMRRGGPAGAAIPAGCAAPGFDAAGIADPTRYQEPVVSSGPARPASVQEDFQ